jgi:hypothetical protein
MGFRDKGQDEAPPPAEISGRHTGVEYDTEVNKKSINMRVFAAMLNQRAESGWRLHTAFEQDGNTVCIFERPK